MNVPSTSQSLHEGLNWVTDIKVLPKIQRIYKYNVVFLNCDHTTFYQDIPDNYSFAQFGNSKVNIQKGKGLDSNKYMRLFFLLTLFHRLS